MGRGSGPAVLRLLLLAGLLTAPLARQSFLRASLLARLKVEGVPLDLLNNVLLLDLAFKTPQGVL